MSAPDPITRQRLLPLLAAAVLVFVAGVTAAFARQGDDDPIASSTTTTTVPTTVDTTTTTTEPPLFPPLDDLGGGALRTPSGIVVPIIGGEPGAYVVRTPCFREAVADGDRIPAAHVVLDPGHGGRQEPGAVGPSGLREADVNLDVALRARSLLEAEGAVVVLTRDTDIRVSIPSRADLIHALRPSVMISIHHNASSTRESPVPGVEMYHQFEVSESARIGGLLHEELLRSFAPFDVNWTVGERAGVRARVDSSQVDFYGMLRRTAGVPSVLSEAAFISNPSEEQALATEEFRQAEAEAIANAVVRYFGTDDPGSGFADAFTAAASPGGGGGTANCTDPSLAVEGP